MMDIFFLDYIYSIDDKSAFEIIFVDLLMIFLRSLAVRNYSLHPLEWDDFF